MNHQTRFWAETSQEQTTDESYKFDYQLDRFLTSGPSRWFAYGRMQWNKDRFRSPETIRSSGAGIGYDWDASAALNLRVQGGVDRLDFTDDETEITGVYHTVIELEYTIERLRDITFFHENEFYWEIGGNGAFFMETKTGFRWPIAQVLWTFPLDFV